MPEIITPEIQLIENTVYAPFPSYDYPEISKDYLPENVSVHFLFGLHAEADHFDAASEMLQAADIFIPEVTGWNQGYLEYYRKISKSNKANAAKLINRYAQSPYNSALLNALQGSNTYVTFVDADEDEMNSFGQQKGFVDKHLRSHASPINGRTTVNELILRLYEMEHIAAQVSKFRDCIMVRNLGRAVTQLVDDVPRLKKRDSIKVLATAGSKHSPLYEHLATDEASSGAVTASTWSNNGGSLALNTSLELSRKISQDKPVDLDFMKRCVIAGLMVNAIPSRSNKLELHVQNNLFRIIADNLDDESLETLLKINTKSGSAADKQKYMKYVEQSRAT